jgi:hypothetical protein
MKLTSMNGSSKPIGHASAGFERLHSDRFAATGPFGLTQAL